MSVRFALLLLLAFATTANANPPSTCGGNDDYSKALCAYQRRAFTEAEAGFRGVVEKGEVDPITIRALYFLARTEMKRGRPDQAGPLFLSISPPIPSLSPTPPPLPRTPPPR